MSGAPRRFAFLVHPLVEPARRIFAVRTFRPAVALGLRPADPLGDVAPITRLAYAGVEGVVIGVPLLPAELLADQALALRAMERAVQDAAPVGFIGLGSVLSVVAGRGAALQEACGLPVTTGNAATAWAAVEVARGLIAERGIRRVGVLGGRATVGKAIAARLGDLRGVEVVVDPQDVRSCGMLVGAHTTGGTLDPAAYPEGVLVDVALPPTLSGPALPGCEVYAGESVALPAGWRRDGWGGLFHLVAGYGWNSVYACLLEPLVALAAGRAAPWAQGKRLDPAVVEDFGRAAASLGLRPERVRLGRGRAPGGAHP